MSTLRCVNVCCGYEGKAILSNLNVDFAEGEAVALFGPNGSGKSTWLKTLSKTLAVLQGRVEIEGKDLSTLDFVSLARKVAYVPQDEPTPFPFTVRDIVTMGRIAQSPGMRDTPEDRSAATEAMTTADCLYLENRAITEISGGEKQRVLIARALAQSTPILLLDEPTSHLDVAHQLAIAELLRRLAESGKTILAAIHDLNLGPRFASRALVLSGDHIALDAPIDQVMSSPVLDDVYKVRFERLATADGPPILVPRPSERRP